MGRVVNRKTNGNNSLHHDDRVEAKAPIVDEGSQKQVHKEHTQQNHKCCCQTARDKENNERDGNNSKHCSLDCVVRKSKVLFKVQESLIVTKGSRQTILFLNASHISQKSWAICGNWLNCYRSGCLVKTSEFSIFKVLQIVPTKGIFVATARVFVEELFEAGIECLRFDNVDVEVVNAFSELGTFTSVNVIFKGSVPRIEGVFNNPGFTAIVALVIMSVEDFHLALNFGAWVVEVSIVNVCSDLETRVEIHFIELKPVKYVGIFWDKVSHLKIDSDLRAPVQRTNDKNKVNRQNSNATLIWQNFGSNSLSEELFHKTSFFSSC